MQRAGVDGSRGALWEMAPRENDRDSRGAKARPIMEKNVEGLKKKLP